MTYSESVFTKAPVTLTCDVFTFDSSVLTRSDEEGTFHDVPLELDAAFGEHGFRTAVYLTHGKDAEGEYQQILSLKIYIRGEDFTDEWIIQHGTRVALGEWKRLLIENPVTKVWEICSQLTRKTRSSQHRQGRVFLGFHPACEGKLKPAAAHLWNRQSIRVDLFSHWKRFRAVLP